MRLSPQRRLRPPVELPLCALIAGWIRAQAQPDAAAQVRVYRRRATTPTPRWTCGRRLRDEIDESTEPIGVLVVADGANTLTPSAPGGYDPDDVDVQRALDDALAAATSPR